MDLEVVFSRRCQAQLLPDCGIGDRIDVDLGRHVGGAGVGQCFRHSGVTCEAMIMEPPSKSRGNFNQHGDVSV